MKKIYILIRISFLLVLTFTANNLYSNPGIISVCEMGSDTPIEDSFISKSHIIVQGTLVSDTANIQSSIQTKSNITTKLNILKNTTIKGEMDLPDIIEIEFSTRAINLRPCPQLILDLDLTEVIVFLKPIEKNGETKYYFSASKNSIIKYEDAKYNQILKTARDQKKFTNNFEKDFKITDSQTHIKVNELISKLRNSSTQHIAINELIALGDKSVPSIIYSMDNFDRIQDNEIKIFSGSGTAKTYSPDLVVDVLAIVLNVITGKHYGYIYNGANDKERYHTINAWKTYLMN